MNKIILIEQTDFSDKNVLIFNNEPDIKDYFSGCIVDFRIDNTVIVKKQIDLSGHYLSTREFTLMWGKEVK